MVFTFSANKTETDILKHKYDMHMSWPCFPENTCEHI